MYKRQLKGFKGIGFSAASGLKSGQFDQKTDSNVVESDTRVQGSKVQG